ncbi:hypothetical protein RJ639_037756 [Escallonia herrerae]|uniref:Retrotransposon gag domain-containing protein n=1 Tax=Escallonia herrerae TaxID=1293975 RepID=A0AA88WPP0_9ASTE|nr:hypothetical protein RJ639_037756 [Escallonia herrerae]
MRQGNLEVTKYYNELQTLWQELDMHYEADWGDLEGNLKFKRHLEKERLYEFLTGLNRELEEVRGSILGCRPLPSTDEAFAEVRRGASRRRVMLGGKKAIISVECHNVVSLSLWMSHSNLSFNKLIFQPCLEEKRRVSLSF